MSRNRIWPMRSWFFLNQRQNRLDFGLNQQPHFVEEPMEGYQFLSTDDVTENRHIKEANDGDGAWGLRILFGSCRLSLEMHEAWMKFAA